MAEKEELKVKGIRMAPEIKGYFEKFSSESGKTEGEWFADLMLQVASNELVLEKNGIPVELRKHFGSDLAALKDATNLITTLFINQMNRVAVEKKGWDTFLQTKSNEYEEKLSKLKGQINILEETVQSKDDELLDDRNTILQLTSKIEGFDKLEAQLRKNLERLENESNKSTIEMQQAREEWNREREKHYKDIDELKNTHKEEKDRQNQRIVDLVDELKTIEPINEENRKLRETIKDLESSIKAISSEFELKVTRIEEQAALDKEKALLIREREIREELYKQSREDMKELYDKVEKLQQDNNSLRIQLNSSKE